ncbi:MAG: tetratricopeptide repeat protein, partial [Armatimonadota bacterium]
MIPYNADVEKPLEKARRERSPMGKSRSLCALVMLVTAILLTTTQAYVAAQPNEDFTQGVQFFEDGQYERAINQLQRATEAQPDLQSAWYYLGRAYLQMPQPDYEAALKAFDAAVKINPHRPGLRLYIGKVYEDQGAYEQAIQVYQEELRLRRGKDVGDVKRALGRVYHLAGKTSQAIQTLDVLVRDNPQDVEALYYLGLAETKMKAYDRAIEHLKKAEEICKSYSSLSSRLSNPDITPAEQRRMREEGLTEEYLAQHYGSAENFVRELGHWPELNKALGDAYKGAGKWPQARTAYRDMHDLNQGGNPADPEPDVLVAEALLLNAQEVFYNQGALFQTISILDGGLEAIEKALEKNENFAPAHNIQGAIYLFQAQTYISRPDLGIESHTYADAIEAFRKAVSLRNDYFDALSNLGLALADVGQVDEAVETLEQAVELRPDSAQARANLAKAYLGQEDAENAIEQAQTALSKDQDNYEALMAAGLVDFMYRNRMGSAIDYFSKAIEANPGRYEAHLHLGNVFFQMESWYRARDEYFKALQSIPRTVVASAASERPYINYLIGHTYHQTRRYDKEIEYLNRALAVEPNYLAALRQIARAYEADRQFEAAKVALQNALR